MYLYVIRLIKVIDKNITLPKILDHALGRTLSLNTLSLGTLCIPSGSYSSPITSRIPLEFDNPKMNATFSYYAQRSL